MAHCLYMLIGIPAEICITGVTCYYTNTALVFQ